MYGELETIIERMDIMSDITKDDLADSVSAGDRDNPLKHSGYIHLKNEKYYSYDFNNGELVIHAYDGLSEISGNNVIVGVEHMTRKQYLYRTELELNFDEFPLFPFNNYRCRIDLVVQDYRPNCRYHEARFCFGELQYFKPSINVVENSDDKVSFLRYQIENFAFDVDVAGVKCKVSFVTGAKGQYALTHSNMAAVSEIVISFPGTEDLGFLANVYNVVDGVFAFICNRRNTTCASMELRGESDEQRCVNGKRDTLIIPCICRMFFINKYREAPEPRKVIEKTLDVAEFTRHIDKLFQLVAEDLTKDDSTGNISIASVHPSLKRRNLIDLQQTLQITGAFEFYVRRYLPPIVEEQPYHMVIRMLLDECLKCPIITGKAKERIKDLSRNVVREPALEEKIKKAYGGYGEWQPLKPCLSSEWFNESDIGELAREANKWRNDLAHEKRSHEPNLNTIRAVRLLEHLNYAIVLRELGYADCEIKKLLEKTLIRA